MTVKSLYQHCTGDLAAHQRSIAAHLAKLEPRRQRIIRARVDGQGLRTIAEAEGISHGSVQSVITKGMEAIRKAIAGEPRFTGGHPGRGGRQKA